MRRNGGFLKEKRTCGGGAWGGTTQFKLSGPGPHFYAAPFQSECNPAFRGGKEASRCTYRARSASAIPMDELQKALTNAALWGPAETLSKKWHPREKFRHIRSCPLPVAMAFCLLASSQESHRMTVTASPEACRDNVSYTKPHQSNCRDRRLICSACSNRDTNHCRR
jgi:hypothetical protein